MSTTGPRIGGLFEGYGGLTMGVQAVLGGEVAWHSEIDPDASRILAHHWPDVPNLGDITKIDWSQVAPVDVLTGGFPCQDLSTAGSRHGMTPTNRSGLWSHFAYAISQLRPALVVIENVRGLLTSRGAEPTEELLAAWDERDRVARIIALIERKHRKAIREGKDFYVQQHATDRLRFMGRHRRAVAAVRRADARIVRAIGTVLGDLARLGYDTQWCGLRAADVDAPHGRYRVFVVATDARRECGEWWPSEVSRGVGNWQASGQHQRLATIAADASNIGHERSRPARDRWPGPADGAESNGLRQQQCSRQRPHPAHKWISGDFGGAVWCPGLTSDADIARSQGREPARRRQLPDGRTAADTSGDGRDERAARISAAHRAI